MTLKLNPAEKKRVKKEKRKTHNMPVEERGLWKMEIFGGDPSMGEFIGQGLQKVIFNDFKRTNNSSCYSYRHIIGLVLSNSPNFQTNYCTPAKCLFDTQRFNYVSKVV